MAVEKSEKWDKKNRLFKKSETEALLARVKSCEPKGNGHVWRTERAGKCAISNDIDEEFVRDKLIPKEVPMDIQILQEE